MSENEMGNRGSKSVLSIHNNNLILTILTFFAFLFFGLSESTEQFTYSQTVIAAIPYILVYNNPDKDKLNIIKDNTLKSGVYRWVQKDSGKCYIGSSINLGKRFYLYYNISYLMKSRSIIDSALLKYGYSNFSLEILEYCVPSKCIEREQYYMGLFEPEYNILKIAGSFKGFKQTEEHKQKIRESLKGNKNATNGLGRQRAEGAGSPSVQIEVFDLETSTKTFYPSMNETGKALGVPSGSIRMYFSRNSQNPYKGRYILKKTDTAPPASPENS